MVGLICAPCWNRVTVLGTSDIRGLNQADELTQPCCVLWCVRLAGNQLKPNSLNVWMSPLLGDIPTIIIYMHCKRYNLSLSN